MRNLASILVVLSLCAGCHTTRILSDQTTAVGPRHEDRQWFTLFGFVKLSDPAGQECPGGLQRASSEANWIDVSISIGLSLAGTLIAVGACEVPDDPSGSEVAQYSRCVSLLSALPPAMISSRTVTYRCGAPSVAGY